MIVALPGFHCIFILLIEKSPKKKTFWADSRQEGCETKICNDKNVKKNHLMYVKVWLETAESSKPNFWPPNPAERR